MIIMTDNLQKMMENLKIANAETYYHAIHVKNLTVKMIKHMNAAGITNYSPFEKDCICKGALLHDLGKLGIENVILTKETTLSEAEWENMKKHPINGYEMVKDELTEEEHEIIKNICLYHHERTDGNGYFGITEVPMYVQIVSACDVFDALSSERVYKKAMSYEAALKIIEDGQTGCYDETIVECLKKAVSELTE